MKCKYCNAEVAPNARFCAKCGGDLTKFDKCMNCGELLDNGSTVCSHCGMKQSHVRKQHASSRKWIWVVSAVILIAIIIGGYLFKGGFTSKVNMSEIGDYYYINGVKYPSYSHLKYIAMNELSHEDVQKVTAICGMTQTEIRDRYSEYRGDCGVFTLRTKDGDYVEYEFDFRPNSKEYMKMLKSEIKRKENAKEEQYSTLTTLEGYINDYWYVMLSYSFDKYNDIQFGVQFRHSTKKKFDRQ